MTNGSRVSSYDLLPSLSIDNILYVPGFPVTYYPLVVSPVPLIVLFFYQKFYLFTRPEFKKD